MGEEAVAAPTAGSRPGSSAAKNRDAVKKRAALWKKQAKCFKLKDVGKKVDAVRFCAKDERFFREQPEVLPLLMGFLTRIKTPELVIETLSVMHTLLSPQLHADAVGNNEAGDTIHPEINAAFMLERSISADSAWKAGEPFVNLFSANNVATDIRIKAIEVFALLVRASVTMSIAVGEPSSAQLLFQSVGSPCSVLLGCSGGDNVEVQYAAISCLRDLLKNAPDENFLDKFESERGISRTLEFISHLQRRFHRPALDILERYSHFEHGRDYLKSSSAPAALRDAIQEAHNTMVKTSTTILSSGVDASPLSAKDAPLLCSNISLICQVFVRMMFSQDQFNKSERSERENLLFADIIDAMVAILRYDIASALTPVPIPSESPRTAGGGAAAAAAANAAATNAAAIATLLPFSSDRCVAVISSLGRMVEHRELCKAHSKTNGVLPVLLDCFKVKQEDELHQVADKLLHLCVFICDEPCNIDTTLKCSENDENKDGFQQQEEFSASPIGINKRIDPNILCAVATGNVGLVASEGTETAEATSPQTSAEKAPLVAVEVVLSLLEASHTAGNSILVFRHIRWLSALVDLPGNANALGDRGVTLFLHILAESSSNEELLFAYLAKCIHAIVLQSATSLELCGTSNLDPSSSWFSFLHRNFTELDNPVDAQLDNAPDDDTILSQPSEEDPSTIETSDDIRCKDGQIEPISSLCKLEWIDEYDEDASFPPKPLTEACHNVDVFLLVSEALVGLTDAFLKWNSTPSGHIGTDFSELLASRLESENIAAGKAGVPSPATTSKKKPQSDQPKSSVVGETIMLSIMEKGMQMSKLLSHYTAVNAAVCVSLLGLLNNLMTVPGGLKALLHLAKAQQHAVNDEKLPNTDHVADTTPGSSGRPGSEWPISVESCTRTEHTLLLLPVINVLTSPDTSFAEIEAAVRSIAAMTSDLDPTEKELLAQPTETVVEAAKSPTKSTPGPAIPIATPTIPELVVCESDRFINSAVASGMLVLLLSFMDEARIPTGREDLSGRMGMMQAQINEMTAKFITLAQVKQESLINKFKEKMEREQSQTPDAASHSAFDTDLNLPYQARWARMLLDHKFSVPRFGYTDYSAILLASELALPKIVTSLLSAGAAADTASPEGMTPLMTAFLVGNEEMINGLVAAHADVDAITQDKQDLSVWNCALTSPVGTYVSEMISSAYSTCENSSTGPSTESLVQLDSIAGSPQLLKLCLQAGMDVNVSSLQGDFLLHALLSGFTVRRKLRGLDLCFRYNSSSEDKEQLQIIVEALIHTHLANVNSCNHMGQTPLHMALLYGHTNIAKTLLLNGANPNIQDQYGQLPLHYACLAFCGNTDGSDGEANVLTRLLLEISPKYPCILGIHADPRKYKSAEEKQALTIEAILESGLQSVIQPYSIMRKLASAQQVLTTPSFSGKFLPWHFACGAHAQLSSVLCLDDDMQKLFEANGRARAELLRYLLRDWNIDIGVNAGDGLTALHLAVKSDVNGNNQAVIDVMLEQIDSSHEIKHNSASSTRCLASLNVNAVHEHTVIDTLPVIPDSAKVVFLAPGHDGQHAYVSSRSLQGKYHIILADGLHIGEAKRNQLQVINDPGSKSSHHFHRYKYLLPMESKFSALHYALQSNHDTLALRLLSLPQISLEPEGSDLPLLALACAARQSPEVIKQLVNQQANMRVHLPLRTFNCDLAAVDLSSSSSIGNRKNAAALHYAVMYDDLPMVEALLTSPGNHVNVNVRRSGDGFTPLHLACKMENMKITKLLLDHGAALVQLSSFSSNGVSPLQLLMKYDSVENDKLKELISENYLRAEMLLEDFTGNSTPVSKASKDSNQAVQEESHINQDGQSLALNSSSFDDDTDAPFCILLHEEEHNLELFERLQSVNPEKRGNQESFTRRLEMELKKSDDSLRAFFNLLQPPLQTEDPVQNHTVSEAESLLTHLKQDSSLMRAFQLLRHPHECYLQYIVRSQWKPKAASKMMPSGSKAKLVEDVASEPTSG